MTDETARALVKTIMANVNRVCEGAPVEEHGDILEHEMADGIAAALREAEAKVLDEAAAYWDNMAETKHEELGGRMCRHFANWCRTEAGARRWGT